MSTWIEKTNKSDNKLFRKWKTTLELPNDKSKHDVFSVHESSGFLFLMFSPSEEVKYFYANNAQEVQ